MCLLSASHYSAFAQEALQLPRVQPDVSLEANQAVMQQAPNNANANEMIRREFERDIALARATGNTGKYIAAHLNAARWYVQKGELTGARKYFSRAVRIARAGDGPGYLPKTLRAISLIYVSSSDEQARALGRRYAEQALVTSESIGDGADIAKSHYQVGIAALATSSTEAAREHFERAFRYQEMREDEFGAGRSLAMIAATLERAALNPNWSFFNSDEPKYGTCQAQSALSIFTKTHYDGIEKPETRPAWAAVYTMWGLFIETSESTKRRRDTSNKLSRSFKIRKATMPHKECPVASGSRCSGVTVRPHNV